jgi:hypothetical protein
MVKSATSLTCVVAAGMFANVAVAEELYLRCEFQKFKCSPEIFRIDLQTGVVTVSCAGAPPFVAGNRAKISNDTIMIPSSSGGVFFSVNRITGDANIDDGTWRGICTKVGSPALH